MLDGNTWSVLVPCLHRLDPPDSLSQEQEASAWTVIDSTKADTYDTLKSPIDKSLHQGCRGAKISLIWGCPPSQCQSNGLVLLRSLTRKKTGGYHVCRQISSHSHGCESCRGCTEAACQLLQTAGSSARALLHAASGVPALRLVTAQICFAVCHLTACPDSG